MARFFALTGMTNSAMGFILGLNLTPLGFLLAIVVIYLILGFFLSGIPIIAMTLPVIYPTVLAMGIDPIWFAMVAIVAIEMGGITPPVGMFCYGVKSVAEPDVSLEDVFIGSIPFLFIWLIALAILIVFPWTATILPSLMR